jgi:hypothetical protein
MKTDNLRRRLLQFGLLPALFVALLVLIASTALAQSTLDLPGAQRQPSITYRPPATPAPQYVPGSRIQTIPSRPMPSQAAAPPPLPVPATPSAPHAEPVLPAIFRGCWQGEVYQLDSNERLPGGASLASWTPKTYRLCYERVGDAPFALTFTEAGIAHDSRIINAQGRMKLLSSDGRTYATMRAVLNFDEYRAHRHRVLDDGGTFAVQEVTKLQCDIESDGMHVQGQVMGRRDGDPWFRATWHTLFFHIPGRTDQVGAGGIPE